MKAGFVFILLGIIKLFLCVLFLLSEGKETSAGCLLTASFFAELCSSEGQKLS